jgi:hypothetical protein
MSMLCNFKTSKDYKTARAKRETLAKFFTYSLQDLGF